MDLWEMDVRRFGAHYRSPAYTVKRIRETYETYYDIRYPGHERQAGPAAAGVGRERVAPRARRGVRREVRLGAGELVRSERGRRRRVAAPARLGRAALVARDRRRAPRDAGSGVALFDESSFSKMEIAGPGRRRLPRGPVRQPRGARGRADHLHPDAQPPRRDRVRLHGGAAGRGPVLDRDRHGVRQPRPRVDPPPPAARRRRAGARRDRAVVVLRDLGPARPRRAAAADAPDLVERGLPVHVACARSPSATCRCARCG